MAVLLEQAIKDQLQAIAQDPKAQMDVRPQKYDKSGTRPITGVTAFRSEDVAAKQHIGAKDPFRQDLFDRQLFDRGRRAHIGPGDRPEDLVDELRHKSLPD